ncbi:MULTISPECIES: hypothetical protein [Amycolatopsis]|uniref:DUF3068 domain-containing protein n=1 Tax=Amycolatopsis bullii TaxID=941987 RepID=A0ABQ3KD47_9PSEU|nr:hypothetical protein [Amycolatopsis bullii]GHG13722.1 hypothetical protein GCM10017567_34270 [Amycolatopsis bullii]
MALIATAPFAFLGYTIYMQESPGTPEHQDLLDAARTTSISVLGPPGAVIKTSASFAIDSEHEDGETTVDINVRIDGVDTAGSAAVILLTGPSWAQQSIPFDGPAEPALPIAHDGAIPPVDDPLRQSAYPITFTSEDLFEAEGKPFADKWLHLKLDRDIERKRNSRVVLHTPRVERPSACPFLKSATARDLESMSAQERERRLAAECEYLFAWSGKSTQAAAVVLNSERGEIGIPGDLRADYVSPAPVRSGTLDWESEDPLEVDGNFVQISQETAGQRVIFFVGIGIGLVVTAAKSALTRLFSALKSSAARRMNPSTSQRRRSGNSKTGRGLNRPG